jgi:hypothetical protein
MLAGKPVWPSDRVQSQYCWMLLFVHAERPMSRGAYVHEPVLETPDSYVLGLSAGTHWESATIVPSERLHEVLRERLVLVEHDDA